MKETSAKVGGVSLSRGYQPRKRNGKDPLGFQSRMACCSGAQVFNAGVDHMMNGQGNEGTRINTKPSRSRP